MICVYRDKRYIDCSGMSFRVRSLIYLSLMSRFLVYGMNQFISDELYVFPFIYIF